MASKKTSLGLAAFAIHCVLGRADKENWDDLGKHSPFGASASPASQVSMASQLELHGVLVEGRETWFNIFDTTTKRSEWINGSAPGHGYLVKQYDKSRELLTVEVQGRMVAVALKPGGGSGIYPASTGILASSAGALSTPPSVAQAPPKNEIKRLNLLAEVIRQRREIREQASRPAGASRS
jgi:hypothetical protein